MPRTKYPPSAPENIPFKIHPRAFAALGADLVTNDVVAVVELVKNSYDAWATDATIRFGENAGEKYLEVLDNGVGMSKATLADVWCVVATPFKQTNPHAKLGDKVRRVSGEKGLGRLSVARLGERLRMWTQEKGRRCHDDIPAHRATGIHSPSAASNRCETHHAGDRSGSE